LCRPYPFAALQSRALKYQVDPLGQSLCPRNWVIGQVSGVCVDSQDHVFVVNRDGMTNKEAEVSRQAPPFIEFDADGKVVNGFGDWKTAPNTTRGCTIDYENNFWTAGNGDKEPAKAYQLTGLKRAMSAVEIKRNSFSFSGKSAFVPEADLAYPSPWLGCSG
jgi:hypothetical protein